MDAVFQSLFTSQRFENIGWFHALMTLISFLASPKLDLLWVLIIAIVLWLRNYHKEKDPSNQKQSKGMTARKTIAIVGS